MEVSMDRIEEVKKILKEWNMDKGFSEQMKEDIAREICQPKSDKLTVDEALKIYDEEGIVGVVEAVKKIKDAELRRAIETTSICHEGELQTKDEECQQKVEGIKQLILQAIVDEPEYPGDMPNELWEELDGNRTNVLKTMRSTVRLTKNGIADRFLQALKKQEVK